MTSAPKALALGRWCLVVPPDPTGADPLILRLSQDCLDAARERGWLILAAESDILAERV